MRTGQPDTSPWGVALVGRGRLALNQDERRRFDSCRPSAACHLSMERQGGVACYSRQISPSSSRGGTGIRAGLKPQCFGMWVRLPPRARTMLWTIADQGLRKVRAAPCHPCRRPYRSLELRRPPKKRSRGSSNANRLSAAWRNEGRVSGTDG